ncbi:ATP-binding protein [Streptomyces sp. V3I7]|uniref:ATP-binding protein n=1 Tax=Streptomyces sp. V3I7 TaxID=3042278 RepID=UPI0027D854B9|nr:ATP-binding protein [Streptomyces sp. V3I7]
MPAHARQEATAVGSQSWRVPDTHQAGRGKAVERHLVLLSVLPAALVALAGAASCAVLCGVGVERIGTNAAWVLVIGTVLVVCGILGCAGLLSALKARALGRRHLEVVGSAARLQAELAQVRWQFDRSKKDLPDRRRAQEDAARQADEADRASEAKQAQLADLSRRTDEAQAALERLHQEIAYAQQAAEAAALEAAERESAVHELAVQAQEGRHFEVFANLARRLESLVHREIGLLDDLENEVENPDLLKGLFRVDHLATRIRRYAENLAVLGGAVSHRLWTQPVSMADVMRSAAAEIEQYARVKMVPPVEGTVSGHAVVDVVHLLAELVENATVFSPPQTQVLLRAEHVGSGLAIEVEDRGLGMTSAERTQMNALLVSPDQVALGELLQDGRIGLYVVSALARRHGIVVQLQNNVYGGTQAVVVLPHELLGRQGATAAPQGQEQAPAAPTQAPAPRPQPPAPSAPSSLPRRTEGPAAKKPARGESDADRPSLPKRRRQEHLAPELRDGERREAPARGAAADPEHDAGLMAAFRTGVRQAEEPAAVRTEEDVRTEAEAVRTEETVRTE